MTLFQTLSEMIDMRSFSNLWYWIALAVLWSTLSHRVLGVPFDMVQRARRYGGQPAQDLEDMVRINVNRLLFVVNSSGVLLLGLTCFLLSVLATLGFYLSVEFAQSVFLLLFPLSLVAMLNIHTAKKILMRDVHEEALYKMLSNCRILVQLMGMFFIFLTAMWGMYQNLQLGALG